MIELLEGRASSESDPVIVDVEPGSRYRYSGGGTTVAHLAFEDQSGLTLDAAAPAYLFEPLGMTRSAYSQPLSGALSANAATAHNSDGQPIAGGSHNYAPIMGAAGLWTTPSDLMRMAGGLQRAHTGTDDSWMTQDTANAMLSRQFEGLGIGFRVGGEDAITNFSHGGSNVGFRARFFAHTDTGDGIAIMTNSSNGGDLIYEILTAVSSHYGWADGWEVDVKTVVEMSEARLDSFSGQYILARPDQLPTSISRDGDILLLNARPYMIDIPLRPDGEDSFFAMNGMAVNFTRDEAGDVVSFTFYGGVLAERVEGE